MLKTLYHNHSQEKRNRFAFPRHPRRIASIPLGFHKAEAKHRLLPSGIPPKTAKTKTKGWTAVVLSRRAGWPHENEPCPPTVECALSEIEPRTFHFPGRRAVDLPKKLPYGVQPQPGNERLNFYAT
jgi:hypothetical protein